MVIFLLQLSWSLPFFRTEQFEAQMSSHECGDDQSWWMKERSLKCLILRLLKRGHQWFHFLLPLLPSCVCFLYVGSFASVSWMDGTFLRTQMKWETYACLQDAVACLYSSWISTHSLQPGIHTVTYKHCNIFILHQIGKTEYKKNTKQHIQQHIGNILQLLTKIIYFDSGNE